MTTFLMFIWLICIAGAAICAKLNRLPVMAWTAGAIVAGPIIFVLLGLWIERTKGRS